VGLQEGDIILSYNGTPTPTFDALASAVQHADGPAEVVYVDGDSGECASCTVTPGDGRIGVTTDDDGPVTFGVEITHMEDGPAAEKGLLAGDIILNFNGTPTPSFEDLRDAVARSNGRAVALVLNGETGDRELVTLFPVEGRIGVTVEPVQVQ
jgi:regulator of sigma E protease